MARKILRAVTKSTAKTQSVVSKEPSELEKRKAEHAAVRLACSSAFLKCLERVMVDNKRYLIDSFIISASKATPNELKKIVDEAMSKRGTTSLFTRELVDIYCNSEATEKNDINLFSLVHKLKEGLAEVSDGDAAIISPEGYPDHPTYIVIKQRVIESITDSFSEAITDSMPFIMAANLSATIPEEVIAIILLFLEAWVPNLLELVPDIYDDEYFQNHSKQFTEVINEALKLFYSRILSGGILEFREMFNSPDNEKYTWGTTTTLDGRIVSVYLVDSRHISEKPEDISIPEKLALALKDADEENDYDLDLFKRAFADDDIYREDDITDMAEQADDADTLMEAIENSNFDEPTTKQIADLDAGDTIDDGAKPVPARDGFMVYPTE